ncbi:hypothetical protein BH20ACI4_BH20ACI4_13150 [soil metagenome]
MEEEINFMDDFKEQCRRQLERSLDQRIKYGFFRQHKPVLDDAPYRVFETMKEYREWADKNLPRYLGYKIADKNPKE